MTGSGSIPVERYRELGLPVVLADEKLPLCQRSALGYRMLGARSVGLKHARVGAGLDCRTARRCTLVPGRGRPLTLPGGHCRICLTA